MASGSHVRFADADELAEADLIMDFDAEYGSEESETERDSSSESDDEDDGEVGEMDRGGQLEAADPGGAGAGVQENEEVVGFVEAWQYEPMPHGRPEDNVGDAGPIPDEDRLHNLEWCQCGQCRVEDSFQAGDCLCCREIMEVQSVADEHEVPCLTTTEAFEAAILNPVSLYIGWLEYTDRWRQAARSFGNRNNEKYRYVAYRKVVRWCWGFLGRDVRVQLPACIHSKIMRSYPDGAGNYKGTVLRVLRL